MPITTVTIDFWNTLFDSSNGIGRNNARQRSLIQTIDRHGITIMGDEYQAAVEAAWAMFHEVWNKEHRTPTPKELVEYIWNFLKLPEDLQAVERLVVEFGESILQAPPMIISGVKEALQILKEKYTLAIVSDTGFSPGSVMKILMKKNNIFDYFTAFSFSNETGVSKPNPKAFSSALDILGCSPANAVHIGDIERTDIAGAKALGMKAILYKGDQTAFLNVDNPEITAADASAHSWSVIPALIDKLNCNG